MLRLHKFKFGLIFIAVLIILLPATCTRASGLSEQLFITVKINGQPIYVDSAPYLKNNRTFVPVRFVAEAFSMEVEWIQDEKKTILKDETKTIEMQLNSNKLIVNGEEITMDATVEGVDGRTMVPIRYFAELMGFAIEWDDATCSVELFKDDVVIPESCLLKRQYTDEDLTWLARLVHVEGHYLGLEAKVAIANVVLNRVKSPHFPNTIYDVIFDKRYSKQFPPAHKKGFPDLVPDKCCVIAAKMALEGVNNADKCLYFNDGPFPGKKKDLYTIIEGEHFYY
jgi:N-acetylmuramoyl-L-alanine amidase